MKIEARRKTLDKLVDEGMLERIDLKWTSDYIFADTGWRVVDRDKLLFDYDSVFFANTYIDREGHLRCHTYPDLMDLRSDLSDEEIERYIRNVAKKFRKCYLELQNRETITAIDSL